jgi:zinc/manganese transport system ATP-binding protein
MPLATAVPRLTQVSFDCVTVRFGANVALAEVTTRLTGGNTVALMGPNGSGKTTLLKLIAGLLAPSNGTVQREGSGRIAYVAQHQHQHRWMPLSVAEVVAMGRYANRGAFRPLRREDRAAITAATERLEVGHLLRRSFGDLSGGQRQRVLVAGALVQDAPTLLLDEPISGLDLPSQDRIREVIREEADAGALVVLSTHHLEEAKDCDRVLLLAGRLVADGSPEEVLIPRVLLETFGDRTLRLAAGELTVLDDHAHGH